MPGNNLPNAPFLNFDKLVHVGIFAVLAIAWMFPFYKEKSLPYLAYTSLALIVYGVIIELVQHNFIYGRSGDFWDALADAFGVVISFVFFILLKKK